MNLKITSFRIVGSLRSTARWIAWFLSRILFIKGLPSFSVIFMFASESFINNLLKPER